MPLIRVHVVGLCEMESAAPIEVNNMGGASEDLSDGSGADRTEEERSRVHRIPLADECRRRSGRGLSGFPR